MRYIETFNEKNWVTDEVNKYKFNKNIHSICKKYGIKNYTINIFDIFRDEDTDEPAIIMDRLNDFLLTIGKDSKKSK